MDKVKDRSISKLERKYERHNNYINVIVNKCVGRPAKKKTTEHQTSTTTEVSVTAVSDLTDSPLPSNHLPTKFIICKMSSQLSSDRHSLSVTHCLTINSDLSWTLSVHGHGMKIDAHMCPLLSKISTKLNKKSSLQQLHAFFAR